MVDLTNPLDPADFDFTVPPLPFGKYSGMPIKEVNRGYLNWCLTKYENGEFDSVRINTYFDHYASDIRSMMHQQVMDIVESDNDYTLSPSQQVCSESITAEITNGANFVRLEGGAGYGKSFVVKDIVRNLLAQDVFTSNRIKASAISYVATQVLKSQLDHYQIDAMTIARLLQMDKQYDGPKEKYVIDPVRTDEALTKVFSGSRSLLIIDEYSMVNDEMAAVIGEAARRYNGCVLVVGDLKQLPPVGQDTDCVFCSIPAAYELTDPMRYSRDSALYKVEQAARFGSDNFPRGTGEVLFYPDRDALFEAFKYTLKTCPHEDNRILFYRRAVVLGANNFARQVLFGDNPQPLEPGERLIVVRTSDYNEIRYYSGTTLDVAEVEEHNGELVAVLANHRQVPILFADTENKADPKQPGGQYYNDTLKRFRDEAIEAEAMGTPRSQAWQDYREFQNSYVFVAYSYATTIHRSQGATVDRVFCHPAAIRNIPGLGQKLAYVALTRARKEVHIQC